MFFKIGVFKYFVIFTGKTPVLKSLCNKVCTLFMAYKDDVTKKERSYVTITTCQRKKGIIILNFTIHLKFKQASLFPRFPKDD